jgi:hypothetical protein
MPLNLEEIANNQTKLFKIKKPNSKLERECRLMLISKKPDYDYDLIAFKMPNSQLITLSYDRVNRRFYDNEQNGYWIIELDDDYNDGPPVLKGGKKSKKRKNKRKQTRKRK